jgi:ABC-2 type transport system ATP-binding protein
VQVVCDGVRRSFGSQVQALADLSLTLEPGVTGLVGVNGAGKTTLLRILAGALRPSGGTVRLDGDDPYGRGRRDALRRTALMPQALDLPPGVRVADAVAYCGWLRGLPMRQARGRASAVLERVGLGARSDHPVRSLSGGMVRRVALAQALVSEPDVLLLDEPTTGLDPEQRAALRELVRGLPDHHITVVSSHVMEDLESLADRIVVLDDARLLFAGTLEEFCRDGDGNELTAEQAFLTMVTRHRRAA